MKLTIRELAQVSAGGGAMQQSSSSERTQGSKFKQVSTANRQQQSSRR